MMLMIYDYNLCIWIAYEFLGSIITGFHSILKKGGCQSVILTVECQLEPTKVRLARNQVTARIYFQV